MMRDHIVFVDDEANILRGLQRMLRDKRDKWDMTFANSAEEALGIMENKEPVAVVSDMRMPKMDGAQLLTKVSDRHPNAVRIILSGYSDQASIFRTVGPAHQYLAKPCQRETLIDTIKCSLDLRDLLHSDDLRQLAAGIKTLPTPPQVYFDLIRELDSPDASVASVADIIASDVAMSTTVLKLTNSAYFSLSTEITTPLQAVKLLGFETIKALTLVVGVFDQFTGGGKRTKMLERLSHRSLIIGLLAQSIAKMENMEGRIVDQASCAGTLSHVGTLLLVAKWPKKFNEAISLIENEGLGIVEAEKRVFGACHAELGAYLLGLWGFTHPIIEAVAYHHEPYRSSNTNISVLTLVHMAQYLTRSEEKEDAEENIQATLCREYMEKLGILDRVPNWRKLFSKMGDKGDLT